MPATPKNVKAVFEMAIEVENPAERDALLDQACKGDSMLRERVEVLLRAHHAAGSFLDRPVLDANDTLTVDSGQASTADWPTTNDCQSTAIGPYQLIECIGEGGMGEVWLAGQTRPVRRQVAVKLIKAGMDSKAVLARFEAERQAVALMDHPNIARVFDAGTTPEGRPFFVMELVRGTQITTYCDEQRLTPRDRLELFVPVCRAVQHAHQKGIVHRDIKPSNILVATYDGLPTPKVIDFGVAKALGGKLGAETLATQFGAVVGTLDYMSPEQTGTNAIDVDTRADIYSLGVLLYELLTGLRPFDSKRLHAAAVFEVIRIIREEDPPKLSSRLSTSDSLASAAAVRQLDPKRLLAAVRGDLDWIVHRCLEKDRNRRYESANGLARDIERYLADEPVEARPPSAGYRLRKLLRRNKGPVLAASIVFLALVAGLVATGIALSVARSERIAADAARDDEARQRQDAINQRDRAIKADLEARERLFAASFSRAQATRRGDRPGRRLEAMEALKEAIETARQLGTLADHRLELRNETIAILSIPFDLRRGHSWAGWLPDTLGGIFDPKMELFARINSTGEVSIRRVSDDEELAHLPALRSDTGLQDFSPDGRYLVLNANVANPFLLRIVEWRTGKTVFSSNQLLSPDNEGSGWVHWFPDGRHFLIHHHTSATGFRVYDASTGRQTHHVSNGGPYYSMNIHPNGQWIAATLGTSIQVLEAATGKLVETLTAPGQLTSAVWGGPDGHRLVASSATDCYVWDWSARSSSPRIMRHGAMGGVAVSIHKSGELLMTTGWDDVTRFWDASTGQELMHSTEVIPISRFARAFGDQIPGRVGRSIVLWDVCRFRECQRFARPSENESEISSFDASPDGRWSAELSMTGGLWFRELSSGRVLAKAQLKRFAKVIFNPRGHELYTLDSDGLKRWPIRETKDTIAVGPPFPLGPGSSHHMNGLATDGTGRRLVAVVDQMSWRIFELDELPMSLRQGSQPSLCYPAISPDGRWLATGTFYDPPSCRVWDLSKPQVPSREILAAPASVAFSPDGNWLVTSTGMEHRFWKSGSWELGPVIPKHRDLFFGIRFDRAGRVATTMSNSRSIAVIDLASFAEETRFESPTGNGFTTWSGSLNSNAIVGVEADGTVVRWDLRAIHARLAEFDLTWDSALAESPRACPTEIVVDSDQSAEHLFVVLGRHLSDSPTDIDAHMRWAKLLLSEKRTDEAIEVLTRAIGKSPNNPRLYSARAMAMSVANRQREACADLDKWLELVSQSQLTPTQLAAECYRLFNAHALYKNQIAQIGLLQAATKAWPTNDSYFDRLAYVYRMAGRFDDAEKAAQEAIRLSRNRPEYHWNLGEALFAKREFDAAVVEFRTAIRLNKGRNHGDFYSLAKAFRAQGKMAEALAAFKKAVELSPDFIEGQISLGRFLLERGDAETAVVHLSEALRLNPWRVSTRMYLSDALRGCGRFNASVNVLGEGLRTVPWWPLDEEDVPRTRAAKSAIAAGFGLGTDAPPASDRGALRRQALEWLTADLQTIQIWLAANPLKGGLCVNLVIADWSRDATLALTCNPWTRVLLPADEQAAWLRFWSTVKAMSKGNTKSAQSK